MWLKSLSGKGLRILYLVEVYFVYYYNRDFIKLS
nr:MAG TPA: hypothetical protein [Caudoviricetes sp.]